MHVLHSHHSMFLSDLTIPVWKFRGLRDCDPVTVYTANLDPDRFSIRIAIHLSIWIESIAIAIRIGRSHGKN